MTRCEIIKATSLIVMILISFIGRLLTATKNDVNNLSFKEYLKRSCHKNNFRSLLNIIQYFECDWIFLYSVKI